MKGLTSKEEEIMNYFWHKGPLFVKELLDFYDEPKPHFNTLSTIVRGLEEKGYVSHKAYGKTYQYFAVVSEESFKKRTLRQVIRKYFNSSLFGSRFLFNRGRRYFTERIERAYRKSRKRKRRTITNHHQWAHSLFIY